MNDNLPLLKLNPSDFKSALKVVNRTKRFIIFIPALLHGGEPLVFPHESRRAGQSIKQGRGVVFFNGIDLAWQGAQGNDEDTIVINDVTDQQAALLLQKYNTLLEQNKHLNLDSIKKLLAYAKDELGILDFYNKRAQSVRRDSRVISSENPFFMEVTKPEIHQAMYVKQAFTFDGPVQQVYPLGAVMVSNGKRCWGVGTAVFLRGYRAVEAGKERVLQGVEQDFGSRYTYQF